VKRGERPESDTYAQAVTEEHLRKRSSEGRRGRRKGGAIRAEG